MSQVSSPMASAAEKSVQMADGLFGSGEKSAQQEQLMVKSPITGEMRPAAKVPTADEIVEQLLSHIPDADADMVRRAYDYASAAHAGQLRLSGDPYIMHPATVA